MSNYKPPSINKDGTMHAPVGSGKTPEGKSLGYIENLPDESISPARKILTEMLVNPEPSYDPDNPNSLFWAVGRKFTADLKVKFLQMTAKYGRVGLAAHSIGISPSTVLRHREIDKRFDELVRDAESYFREATAAVIMQQAREGLLERRWNSQGQLISERRTYETQLRIKLLDWCDPSFNAPTKQEIEVKGGAIMIPPTVDSVDDWEAVLAEVNRLQAPEGAKALPTDSPSVADSPSKLPVEEDLDSLDAIANGSLIYKLPDEIDP